MLRDVYKKPIINDEINYEGNLNKRWGQLSGQEMAYRFWNAYIGGGYATHGETLPNDWLSAGGKLMGESPKRIAFLKKILEASPRKGLEPIDRYFFPNYAGEYGELPYLFCQGHTNQLDF